MMIRAAEFASWSHPEGDVMLCGVYPRVRKWTIRIKPTFLIHKPAHALHTF